MSDGDNKIQIHRGLKGVYFDRSPTSFIDGRAGTLLYRGYSIHDLAAHSTFEETGDGLNPLRAISRRYIGQSLSFLIFNF